MPAPQKGSSSRLLKRTATMFEPAMSTTTANAPRIRRSITTGVGRFVGPVIGG